MPIARPVTTAFSGGGCGHAGGFPGGKRFFPKGPGCGTFLMDSRGHPNLPFSDPARTFPNMAGGPRFWTNWQIFLSAAGSMLAFTKS